MGVRYRSASNNFFPINSICNNIICLLDDVCLLKINRFFNYCFKLVWPRWICMMPIFNSCNIMLENDDRIYKISFVRVCLFVTNNYSYRCLVVTSL